VRVLVIDDEPLVRRALMRALQSRGHKVALAENGKQGLEVWKAFLPDLVYLDVLMPEMSGLQVLTQLSKEVPEGSAAKVILISAYSGDYDIEKAKAIGANLFLPKPFEDIMAVVTTGEKLTLPAN